MVEHAEKEMDYSNLPTSPWRPPSNQFELDHRAADFSRPVVAIITATQNCRAEILETAESLVGQSMQNFIWIIVDDHTTRTESLELLNRVALDPRVVVIKNEGEPGLATSRNVGLAYALSRNHVAPYLVSLDDDDLFELTALEKLAWFLESNSDFALAGSTFVKFGASNETVFNGLHSVRANFDEQNYVPNGAMYRSSIVMETGCKYDPEGFNKGGGEDWDFWMCLAEAGWWGGTINEHLYWYRVNTADFRAKRWGDTFKRDQGWKGFHHLHDHIKKKHAALLDEHAFPLAMPKLSTSLDLMSWDAPFDPHLVHADKTIMFIIPWLMLGGADVGALHQMQTFADLGYRVTVVCTLFDYPSSIELRPQMMTLTHDLHILPTFLRAKDQPRYIKYLIESRGIAKVLISNSQLAYELLPALVEQLPRVEFYDYLHNEAYDGWKTGGYPQYSLIYRRYLARTIASSEHLRDWLVERGYPRKRIGLSKLGIDTTMYQVTHPAVRKASKRRDLAVEEAVFVVAVVGRMDPQKRPLLVPKIAKELLKRGHEYLLFIVMGGGDLFHRLEAEIRRLDIGKHVRLLGSVDRPTDYLESADTFLLPSMSEGLSIAVAEAMAMGLPVVTANAGALPEQLGLSTPSPAGVLVNHTLTDDAADASMYADAIEGLILSPSLRHWYGTNGRNLVEATFDYRSGLGDLVDELAKGDNVAAVRQGPRIDEKTMGIHPAAYGAVQSLLYEQPGKCDLHGTYHFLDAHNRRKHH